MGLTVGTHLGPYEITAPLGAGGMGEVYRAIDTRLDRTVAIKVLPEHVASNPELKQRFEREAKTLAALSHPHICTLFDVGRLEHIDFLVIEYLEGDTLERRLKKGALPLDQALQIGIQIADALAAAHRAGVVHRDLKPGNIMLMKSGAKLLDFGLAKTATPAVAGSLSMLPTTPPGLTQESSILGTVPYMAPEQTEGREADARSDIWALGAVFYEMVTGTRPFEGDSPASVIAAILKDTPPPLSARQRLAPPLLDRVVAKCLAKDPDARWQTARDLHDELRWVAESRSSNGAAHADHHAHARLRERAVGAVAALAVAAAGAVAWLNLQNPVPAPIMTRFGVMTPPTTTATSFAVSPDGRQLAYVATTEGQSRLWVRPLNETSARALEGTEGAAYPFWAPDGRAIGFFAEGKLKRADLAGGAPRVLADAPTARGGAWNAEDVIVFAPDQGFFRTVSMLMRVSASGGMPIPVTRLAENERSHRWPIFLPDGRRFLFFSALADPDVLGVYLGSLDATQPRRVFAADASVGFVPPDHLLFVREDVLMAARFDSERETIVGEPQPLAQPIGRDEGTWSDMFSASPDVLAYRTTGGGQRRQLMWVDRTGNVLATVGSPDDNSLGTPELDPTGQRIAVIRVAQRNTDVWLMDTGRRDPTRFTFDPATEGASVWSPDGRRMVFGSYRGGRIAMHEKPTSGAEDARVVAIDAGFPMSWSPDGRFALYSRADVKTGVDLWALPMTGEPKPFSVVQAGMDQRGGEFSPDGRWLAYESNESGRFEVHVQPFPQAGGKWQASSAGGTQVRWRRDGRELYYLAPDSRLMAVSVAASPDGKTLNLGMPVPLFQTRLATGANVIPGRPQYAVAPDGRFLLNTIVEDTPPSPITVVVNWRQMLQEK